MSDRLDAWLKLERLWWSDLVTHDDGLPNLFDELARRTQADVEEGRPFSPRWQVDSAFNPVGDQGYYGFGDAIADEWRAYEKRWESFVAANPRVRLAWMIGWVSETHDASSWPAGWSHVVREWVRAGFPEPRPFDDRLGIDTPTWRRELARAADEAGDGWVYDEDDRLVWSADGEPPRDLLALRDPHRSATPETLPDDLADRLADDASDE